jgi:hypothetical protein
VFSTKGPNLVLNTQYSGSLGGQTRRSEVQVVDKGPVWRLTKQHRLITGRTLSVALISLLKLYDERRP